VRAYNAVNHERATLKSMISRTSTLTAAFFFTTSFVFLYDYEFRPWGVEGAGNSWPLMMMFIAVGINSMLMFAPMVDANEFYEKLAAKVAESVDGDFLWSPADRTNFLTLIANSKVSFQVLNFELSAGYYVAVPSLLFGWHATRVEPTPLPHRVSLSPAGGTPQSLNLTCTGSGCWWS